MVFNPFFFDAGCEIGVRGSSSLGQAYFQDQYPQLGAGSTDKKQAGCDNWTCSEGVVMIHTLRCLFDLMIRINRVPLSCEPKR